MNEFEKNSNEIKRKGAESTEMGTESREKQAEEAEKKMAAKERVEVVAREVKNTKQQIANIMANMTAVVKAVAAIRAQLQVAQNDGDIPSVKRDEQTVEKLKKKLEGLFGEIADLKVALLAEEQKAVGEENKGWGAQEIEEEATARVRAILEELGIN